MLVALMTAFTFTSCEDVPAPYDIPNGGNGGETTPSTGQATGDGSKENPFNSVAANQMASKLASGEKTDKQYYIKGKVVSVKEAFSATFGNASFYISDDGKEDNKFYVFRTLYLNNEKWTEGQTNVAVGDEVVVCGSLINYMGNTPETVQGETYLVSLKSNGGGTETPDTPDTPEVGEGLTLDTTNGIVTMMNAGVEEGSSIEVSVADMNLEGDEAAGTPITSITLSDGTKIEFDGGGETNKPTYFKKYKSIRVYKNNGFTVTGKSKIAKIVFTCDGAQNVGNKTATLVFSGNTATYKNVYTETKGGGVQFRFKSVKIVYAK